MNKSFFASNREKVAQYMEDNSIAVFFAGEAPHKSADYSYDFTVNKNFYYLTGLNHSKLILVISKKKGVASELIFVEKSDPVMEKWVGKKVGQSEASELSGVEKVQYLDSFEKSLAGMLAAASYDSIYLDLERMGWGTSLSLSQEFARTITEKYPYLRAKDIYKFVRNLRMLKTEEEVERIKKAIDITMEGIGSMMRHSRPGLDEFEVEAYFDFTLKSAGTKTGFNSIVASGANATVLHYEDNNSRIADGSLILTDLGAQYLQYTADISRTFPANGKFTERQKVLYNIVLKAQLETINAIKPGVPFRSLNETTKQALAKGLKEINLIKEDAELSKYYYHGVSHYLGLDVHDPGDYDVELKEGMVLTVEPGLYVEEEGIGIRIEDDILVTAEGCEVLSKNIIKTVEEIEGFMGGRRDV